MVMTVTLVALSAVISVGDRLDISRRPLQVVYSCGVDEDPTYEVEMARAHPECEVHAFDPSPNARRWWGYLTATAELPRKVCKETKNICKKALPLLIKRLSLIKPWLHIHSRVGLCIWHDLILRDLFKFDAILRAKL